MIVLMCMLLFQAIKDELASLKGGRSASAAESDEPGDKDEDDADADEPDDIKTLVAKLKAAGMPRPVLKVCGA